MQSRRNNDGKTETKHVVGSVNTSSPEAFSPSIKLNKLARKLVAAICGDGEPFTL